MITHYNNVAQTVSGTPVTGTITLSTAVSGAQTLGSATGGGNATVDVFITDGTAWEVARNCTYTHSGTTLTRGTLEASSTGSALSLTSSAVVRVALPATKGNRLEATLQAVTPGGRLTTESGVPVSTSDRTSQSTIYYTPFVHNVITLWDGADWVPTTFSEVSLALSGLTASRPYDVFGYLSSGALAIEILAWTNDTTRATAVTLQDGRYCKSGDKTRLLLGTIYTTATNATADANATRYIGNLYNTVARVAVGGAPAANSHTYTSGTVREWNGGTGVTRARWIQALQLNAVGVYASANMSGGSGYLAWIGPGLNSTTAYIDTEAASAGAGQFGTGANATVFAQSFVLPGLGYNYLTVLQGGNTNTTYYNCQCKALVYV